MYAVDTDASAALCVRELSVFVMERALVTVRKSAQFDVDTVRARWDAAADELGSEGVGFLLHGLLDVIVDGHTATLRRLDDDLEDLDDILFTDSRADIDLVQRRSYELRKDLLQLRRVVVPMRDALVDLMKRDTNLVTERLQPYYQDVYDHSLRAAEGADALRDLVHTLLETNMMVQANRMNLVMKKVTSWAAIVAVPTLITGFFGQNLPFPGFERSSGFALSCALIVGLAVLLYFAFKRWEWL
jgi:magnesium transporter